MWRLMAQATSQRPAITATRTRAYSLFFLSSAGASDSAIAGNNTRKMTRKWDRKLRSRGSRSPKMPLNTRESNCMWKRHNTRGTECTGGRRRPSGWL